MSTPFDRFIEGVHCLFQAGYATMKPHELARFNLKNEPDITAGLSMRIQQLLDTRAVPSISRAWCLEENGPENLTHLPLSKQPPAKETKTARFEASLRRTEGGALLPLRGEETRGDW